MLDEKIGSFFNACSLAVIGATANQDKLGYHILHNILGGGYAGKVFAINQKGGSVMGLNCYESLDRLPETPELIIVIVPARFVVDIIHSAGKRGVKAAIIISGGFGETGNAELEAELADTAKHYEIRILGPNCQGLTYNPNHMCASWPLVSQNGKFAVVAHSGTVGAEIGIRAQREGLGISAIVSLGNKCDLNEIDFLDYFSEDPNVTAIGLYLEGVKDGKRFIDAIRKAALKKPIVVLKAGRTSEGRQAVASHTKSLAGSSEVFSGLCRQYGVINTKTIGEFYESLKGAAYIKPFHGKNVLVITSSGGSGALAADLLVEANLNMSGLSPETHRDLTENLPVNCIIKNPLDLTGDANAQRFEDALMIISKDKNIDTILVIFGDPFPGVGETIIRIKPKITQNLVLCYLGGGEIQENESRILHAAGIPVFPTPDSAVTAMKFLTEYGGYISKAGVSGKGEK